MERPPRRRKSMLMGFMLVVSNFVSLLSVLPTIRLSSCGVEGALEEVSPDVMPPLFGCG